MPTGQGLADLLSGAAGAPVNRPALNAFVANSQARNGLLSAQTQDALIQASQAQEAQEAHDKIKEDLMSNGAPESEATLARDFLVGAHGNDPVTALKALGMAKLGYGSAQSQTGGQQMFEGKLAAPVAVPNTFQTPPGSGLAGAPVQQSPQGEAQTADTQSQTALRNAQANAGGFNPHTNVMATSPEQQQKLTTLLSAGYIGPTQMYSFSRNPSLIDSAFAAYNNDPVGSIGIAHAKQQLMTNLTSGQMSRNMTSLNTAVAHMGLVPQVADALQNGDYKLVNKMFQGFSAQTGSSAPALADQLSQFLGREIVNAVQANGGGEREREAAQAIYDRSQAPGVLADVAAQGAQLLSGRAQSIEQDYVGTMSMGQPNTEGQYSKQFRSRFLTPQTRQVTGMGIAGESINGTGSPTTPKEMPDAATLAAYAGAHFGGDLGKATSFLKSQGYE